MADTSEIGTMPLQDSDPSTGMGIKANDKVKDIGPQDKLKKGDSPFLTESRFVSTDFIYSSRCFIVNLKFIHLFIVRICEYYISLLDYIKGNYKGLTRNT